MPIKAEYIWVDGTKPTQKLRSKTKVVDTLDNLPEWGFDGSSTYQAEGRFSDCILRPVTQVRDPVRNDGSVLVMCEVFNPDGSPHPTNTRAALREVVERTKAHEPLFGIEQEYTLFRGMLPLGWPEGGYPAPQGPFYCGVGADEVFGRPLVEKHFDALLSSGIVCSGINAEVMPGQWEFQIGPLPPLEVSDQLHLARWLLYRIAEEYQVVARLHPKPVKGDWNGAGAHTNYSTKTMREPGGFDAIVAACEKLGTKHDLHIANYGDGIKERLTGQHETCSFSEFKFGVGDRGASIRIPLHVKLQGMGYLEDRRPCANVDPYVVTRLMLETTLL